jgi:cob(I)alamin adenosyltransferase
VCRRAERTIVTLARREDVDARVIVYVNRLSDLLFVLARHENRRSRRPEQEW